MSSEPATLDKIAIAEFFEGLSIQQHSISPSAENFVQLILSEKSYLGDANTYQRRITCAKIIDQPYVASFIQAATRKFKNAQNCAAIAILGSLYGWKDIKDTDLTAWIEIKFILEHEETWNALGYAQRLALNEISRLIRIDNRRPNPLQIHPSANPIALTISPMNVTPEKQYALGLDEVREFYDNLSDENITIEPSADNALELLIRFSHAVVKAKKRDIIDTAEAHPFVQSFLTSSKTEPLTQREDREKLLIYAAALGKLFGWVTIDYVPLDTWQNIKKALAPGGVFLPILNSSPRKALTNLGINLGKHHNHSDYDFRKSNTLFLPNSKIKLPKKRASHDFSEKFASQAKQFFDTDEVNHSIPATGENYLLLLHFLKDRVANADKTKLLTILNDRPTPLIRSFNKIGELIKVTNKSKQAQKRTSLLEIYTLGKLFGWETINDIDIESWEAVKTALTPGLVFSPLLGYAYAQPLRPIANAIAEHHSNSTYKFWGVTDQARTDENGKKKGTRYNVELFFLTHPHYSAWREKWDEWVAGLNKKRTNNYPRALLSFVTFVLETSQITDPHAYFTERRHDFFTWLTTNHPKDLLDFSRLAYEFSIHFVDTYLCDKDKETGETTYFGKYLFTAERYKTICKTVGSDTNKSILTESSKTPMPLKYVGIVKEILAEDDYAWPKTLAFEYFTNGLGEEIWCPVNTLIFQIMLELPLRKIQVRFLDSGEGDPQLYDIPSNKWVSNTSAHANHWKKMGNKVINRGVLNPSKTNPGSVDIYINTNKTQDISKGFGEECGYTIPWHNQTVIEIVTYMRQWQETHNPVKGPKKATDVPNSVWTGSPSQTAKEQTPDRFYLFRSPIGKESYYECPPNDNQLFKFWNYLMQELEDRLQEQGEDMKIIGSLDRNGHPSNPLFTPHGLRVTGLTAFMMAGVPIEILSKIIAGHATILMSLHYIIYNNAHISDILTKASKQIEDSAQQEYRNFLLNASWKDAQKYCVFGDENMTADKWIGAQQCQIWGNNYIGFCPNAGTQCSNGGPLIKAGTKTATPKYGPVEGGDGNCIMCRHICTGYPFLTPLALKGEELLAKATKLSEQLGLAEKQQEAYNTERDQIRKKSNDPLPPELHTKMQQIDIKISTLSLNLDFIFRQAHRITIFIEAARSCSRMEGDQIVQPQYVSRDDIVYTDVHPLKQMDYLVQAGRLYDFLDVDALEDHRNRFIDTILSNSDMKPISISTLTHEEKQRALDAAAKFLVQTLEGRLDEMEKGTITLQQLGLQETLTKLIDESVKLIQQDQSTQKSLKGGEA